MTSEYAQTCLKEGRIDEAIELLNHIIMKPPVDLNDVNALGVAYFSNKEYVKARGIFDELVVGIPTYEIAKINIAMTINHMTNSNVDMPIRDKIKELKLALYYNPNCFEAWYNLATYYTQLESSGTDKYKKALVAIRTAMIHKADDIDGLILLGNICIMNKKWDDAIHAFDAILEKDSSNTVAIEGKITATKGDQQTTKGIIRLGYITYYYKGVQKVCDGLWIGSRESSRDLEVLKGNNITHILNMAVEEPNFFENKPDIINMIYKKVDLRDSGECDILNNGLLVECLKFVDDAIKQGGQVLVHCQAGMSRSGAIAVAYVMSQSSITYEDALTNIRKVRYCVAPNGNFETQIKGYFDAIRPKPQVVERRPTPQIPPPLNLTPTVKTYTHGINYNFFTSMFDIYKK